MLPLSVRGLQMNSITLSSISDWDSIWNIKHQAQNQSLLILIRDKSKYTQKVLMNPTQQKQKALSCPIITRIRSKSKEPLINILLFFLMLVGSSSYKFHWASNTKNYIRSCIANVGPNKSNWNWFWNVVKLLYLILLISKKILH